MAFERPARSAICGRVIGPAWKIASSTSCSDSSRSRFGLRSDAALMFSFSRRSDKQRRSLTTDETGDRVAFVEASNKLSSMPAVLDQGVARRAGERILPEPSLRGAEGGSYQWSRSPSVEPCPRCLLSPHWPRSVHPPRRPAPPPSVWAGGRCRAAHRPPRPERRSRLRGSRPGRGCTSAPTTAGAVGTEVDALVQTGQLPERVLLDEHEGLLRLHGHGRRRTRSRSSRCRGGSGPTSAPTGRAANTDLIVNGVVGEADVWVNGHEVATRDTVQGDYTRYTFDVTGLLRHGANTLALEVYPNDPSTMFTLDNVDWTQIPPDNNTGIQFPIQLHSLGPAGAEQRARRAGQRRRTCRARR